jgi:hypothetical protein
MALKTYVLTIEYDEESEEVEYLTEQCVEEEFECLVDDLDISQYWDEETMKLISEIYDVGIS